MSATPRYSYVLHMLTEFRGYFREILSIDINWGQTHIIVLSRQHLVEKNYFTFKWTFSGKTCIVDIHVIWSLTSYWMLRNGSVIGRISELLFEGKIYSKVDNNSDAERMQQDLNELVCWSGTWLLSFNAAKCKIMHIGRNNNRVEYEMERCKVRKCPRWERLGSSHLWKS